jgi:hypothetical protein
MAGPGKVRRPILWQLLDFSTKVENTKNAFSLVTKFEFNL